jgi:NAD+ synthase
VHGLIEGGMSAGEISAEGHDPALVERVWGMVDRAEYKRRQAPPGVKVTHRAFGRDRRYPITNGFTADR